MEVYDIKYPFARMTLAGLILLGWFGCLKETDSYTCTHVQYHAIYLGGPKYIVLSILVRHWRTAFPYFIAFPYFFPPHFPGSAATYQKPFTRSADSNNGVSMERPGPFDSSSACASASNRRLSRFSFRFFGRRRTDAFYAMPVVHKGSN